MDQILQVKLRDQICDQILVKFSSKYSSNSSQISLSIVQIADIFFDYYLNMIRIIRFK